MDQARWRQLQDLLDGAWEVPAAERAAWLEEHCDDQEVRDRAERLLALDEEAEDYFGRMGRGVGVEAGDDDEPQADLSGRRVGNYRLLEPLGRGGMGVVYLAERADGTFEYQVAVKLLAMGLSTPEMRSRFVTERQILADLEHPAIARLLDGGVAEDGTPYFVMERVDGQRIDSWCDARQLGVRERMDLLCRVCEAVEYAHRRLVIHRDLKPSNVLVTADGDPKLLDFGVAKLLDDPESGHTVSGLTVSQSGAPLTPTWAAPEQIEHGRVTTATDTYSLGALACLLLAGAPPRDFDSRTPAAIARTVRDEPTAPSRRLASLSDEERSQVAAARGLDRQDLARRLNGDLDAIVLKALAYEPERRYGSAAEMAADLKAHLAGRPVTARAPTLGYRASRFVARNRLGVAAAALVALSLVGGLGAALWQADRARDAAALAEQNAERHRQALRRSNAIRDFLFELFRNNIPGSPLEEVPTTLELLESAADSVDERFPDDPETQAEFLTTLAAVYQGRGLRSSAREMRQRVLELREKRRQEAPVEYAVALSEYADSLSRDELAEAERLQNEATTLLRHHAPGTVELARAYERRAEVYFFTHDTAKEVHDQEQAWEILSVLDDVDAQERFRVSSGLALAYQRNGEYENALTYLGDAIQQARELYGDVHLNVAKVTGNRGGTHIALGRFSAAEADLRTAIEQLRKVFEHPTIHVLTYLRGLEYVARLQGDFATALKWRDEWDEAAARAEWDNDTRQRQSARSDIWRAQSLVGMERGSEASVLVGRGLAVLTADPRFREREELNLLQAYSVRLRIACAAGQSRGRDIEGDLAQVRTLAAMQVAGVGAESKAEGHALIGLCAFRSGDIERSLALFEKAAEVDARFPPGYAAIVAERLLWHGQALRAAGREDEARAKWTRGAQLLRDVGLTKHPVYTQLTQEIGAPRPPGDE